MEQQELIITMALGAWNVHIKRTNDLLGLLSDEQLQNEVSPNRNTGVYLLGHLTAVHDAILPLFGSGEKIYPQLEEIFIKNPDRSGLEKPSIRDLRSYWHEVNEKLNQQFKGYTIEDWFQKHNAISEDDFKKEPFRNKLNVLINRTNHLAFHLGQLIFLKK